MTEQHRAKPEEWAAVERLCKNGIDTLNCTLELRARVEALEAAQRPTVEDSLTVPADSLAGRQLWASMRFRGVMLLPPPDCADPDFWIAERIYEMGFAKGQDATTSERARDAEALEAAVNAQPEATVPSHHRGHAATAYREGFHAGYKHALACVSRSWLQAGIEAGEAGIQRKALIHFESFADTFEGAGGDADLIIRALKSTLNPS